MSRSGPPERVIQGAGSARPQCRHRALPMHLAFEPAGSPCPGSGFAVGRALHARKGRRRVELWHIPARSPAVPLPRMIMLCPGLRPACNPGAETAPLRENRLSRHLRAFHRKAISPWMALPAEGRAPHARKQDFASTGRSPH